MIYIIDFYLMFSKFIIWFVNIMISLIEDIDEPNIKELFKIVLIIILLILILILILFPIFILEYILSKLFKEDNNLSLNDIILKMNKLDDIKNDITSAEYLNECNRLKSIYDKIVLK